MRVTDAQKAREDVAKIKLNLPPGTLLRHKPTGSKCMMGAQYGAKEFWVLCYDPAHRGVVSATAILEQYERAKKK